MAIELLRELVAKILEGLYQPAEKIRHTAGEGDIAPFHHQRTKHSRTQ